MRYAPNSSVMSAKQRQERTASYRKRFKQFSLQRAAINKKRSLGDEELPEGVCFEESRVINDLAVQEHEMNEMDHHGEDEDELTPEAQIEQRKKELAESLYYAVPHVEGPGVKPYMHLVYATWRTETDDSSLSEFCKLAFQTLLRVFVWWWRRCFG